VRVTQNWAGAGWGGQIIPRIGMEVMVTYIDGDPDRPVVTGVVPNPKQKVPYALPENKTKSVFRTQSHKKYGYNEITFEDETGLEQIHIRAERDMNTIVQRDKTKFVRGEEISRNIGNKMSQIKGNFTSEISGFSVSRVSGNYNISIGGEVPVSELNTSRRRAWNAPELMKLTSHYDIHQNATDGGNLSISAKSDISTYSVGDTKFESESATIISSGEELVLDSIEDTTIYSQNNSIFAASKQISITAGKKIFLKCGESSIEITQKKITIKSPKIELN
jgi:type VI secretion system secreted protein VgrG